MTESANKAKAAAFLQAISDSDVGVLAELMTKDIVIDAKGSSVVSAKRGYEVFMELVAGLKDSMEDGLHFDILTLTEEGDRVVCEAAGTSRLKGGPAYDNEYVFVITFRDGKICEVHEYFDTVLADATVGPVLTGG